MANGGSSSPGDPKGRSETTQDLDPRSTAADVPRQPIPLQIGPYRIKHLIGSGGMGNVYEAMQEHPRRVVALKVMKPGMTSRSAFRRFEYESQILARLRHPNIAQVYDAGTHDDGNGPVPYFVLEYIPNARSITEYARDKHLSARQRLELFAKVCDAVHHGHQKGIIHRDLKPSNIVVDANGEPKIIDFGVARSTDSDLAITTLQTDVGQLIGTLQYMSPEQVEADPHAIDGRTDVYSLGVVLYELLSDRLPYSVSGTPVLEAARIIKEDPPSRLSTVDTKLGGDLETIVLTSLEKEPGRRYQTAYELYRDIERYLADEPIVAHRPSVGYIVRSRTRALFNRHPVGGLTLVVLIAFAFAGLLGNRIVHEWTPGQVFYKWFLANMPWPETATRTLERVRVVRITDEAVARAEDLARTYGFTDVSSANFRSMRRLHGPFMERLAAAGVKSVTWDLTFAGAAPFDEDFVRGAKALSDAGVDVVVSVKQWPLDEGEPAVISPNIEPYVRWGGTTANFLGDAEWNLHLFIRRQGNEPRPSLALESVAAYRQPGPHAFYMLDRKSDVLQVRYVHEDSTDGEQRPRFGPVDEIVLSTYEPYTGPPDLGRRPGDEVGIFIIDVPPDPVLDAASVDYHWVFEAGRDDLRERFSGKAVVIGDFRTGRDRHPHPDGRMLGGAYGHAVGIEALLDGGAIRVERDEFAWVSRFLMAVIGVGIAMVSATHVGRRVLLLLGVSILMVFSTVFAYRALGYFVNPLVGLLAMIVACELAVGVNRARQARLT